MKQKTYTYTFTIYLAFMDDCVPLSFQADTDLEAMQKYCLNEYVQELLHDDIRYVTFSCRKNQP